MTIDRSLWESTFTRFHAPRWLCSKCSQGHFVLIPESFYFRPTAEGYERVSLDQDERGNDLPLRFSATMQCDNSACQETSSAAGSGQEKETTEYGTREFYHVFSPTYVHPSPDIFPIPIGAPPKVAKLLKSAFSLSWSDYEACLNRLRVCIELILDERKIKRSSLKAGKRKPLNLHQRIELTETKIPKTKPFLMAMKYLGNAGSHAVGLKKDVVFDAFDLMLMLTTELYGGQRKVNLLARRIVKKRGPIRPKFRGK
jgi:Domain of unknown function (DUF4145)